MRQASSWADLHHLLVREKLLQQRIKNAAGTAGAVAGWGIKGSPAPVLRHPAGFVARSRTLNTFNGISAPPPSPRLWKV